MQIIQKIREKGAAIVIVVITLSLIGFILMDANLGMSRNAGGSGSSVGKINGKTITGTEYENKVKVIEDMYGGKVSGTQLYQLRQGAWDQLVYEKVTEAEYEKLGLSFSPKELSAVMFSNDAPQSLKQAFTDKATGQYDINKAQQWWTSAKKFKGEQKEAIENQVVEPMRQEAMRNKYSGMLAASAYYPAWMKDKEATEAKTFANISYVAVPYSVINDSTVKVSDEDIMNYISKRKAKYTQDGGRRIAYVSFSANPSGADTAKVFETVANLRETFVADTNAKVFVSKNMSATKFQDAFTVKSKLPAAQKDTLASLATGAVYGPYLDGKNIVLAKMLGSTQVPDSIKARHILISTNPQSEKPMDDSSAKKLADSLLAVVNAGGDFAALALNYSADGSKEKGGDLGTFAYGEMVPEFNEFVATKPVGSKGVVQTQFGYHVIDVLGQSNFAQAYKIAYLSKEIVPSDETVNKASAQASKLSSEARDLKSFNTYLDKNKNLQKIEPPTLVKENDYSLGGLQDARQLIIWANGAKAGDVSEPYSIGDDFVVGVVTKIVPEGLPDVETIRPQVEYLVRNAKKAETIKAKLTATPTLETAAAAYPNLQVTIAGADSSLTFSSSAINGVLNEPKLIGASFNKAYQTKVSEPIEGSTGVYVLKVNSTGTKNLDIPANNSKQKTMAQQMAYGWFEGLKKNAAIKDERSKSN